MTRVQGAPKTAKENGKKEAVSPHPEGFQRVSKLPGIRNSAQNWDMRSGPGPGDSELISEHWWEPTRS